MFIFPFIPAGKWLGYLRESNRGSRQLFLAIRLMVTGDLRKLKKGFTKLSFVDYRLSVDK